MTSDCKLKRFTQERVKRLTSIWLGYLLFLFEFLNFCTEVFIVPVTFSYPEITKIVNDVNRFIIRFRY